MKERRMKQAAGHSGQAIVLVALLLIGILGFAVLALDGGQYLSQRRTSQNASDMSALAGVYLYAHNKSAVPAIYTTEKMVLSEINRVAEINGIPDTDGTPGNGVNANVQAWWLDRDGNEISENPQIDNLDVVPPAGVNAIKVRTFIPYQAFLAGLFNQSSIIAQSDGTARITILYDRAPTFTDSLFTVSTDCDNLTDRIAHHYEDTNTARFLGSVSVNGSLAVGSVNASEFYGDFKVRVVTGTGPRGGPYTATSSDPFAGGGNRFEPPAQYIAPTTPPAAPYPLPPPLIVKLPDGTTKQLDAADFRPVAPIGEMYRRYQLYWDFNLVTVPPNEFYHYVSGPDLASAVNSLYNAGKRGIYYVEGDLTVPAGMQEWEGITLIVTGKFNNVDANHDFWTAGWTSSGRDASISELAMNISVLAGADLGMPRRCASDPNDWVFSAENNNSQYHGLVYIPYGQINFHGNTAGGSTSKQFSEGVITYSVYLNGNSWQFDFSPELLVQPYPATELFH